MTNAQEMFDNLESITPKIANHKENYHHKPVCFRDKVAKIIVHVSATCADFLFQNRYGHRAVVLETIAAVPGMVGGLLNHLKSLRLIKDDHGWIKTLIDEAENERIHLLVYSEIYKPNIFERLLIIVIQFCFYNMYFFLYLLSPATAHRVVGYFEEEAINSYENFLSLIENGMTENKEATELAKRYWNLENNAKLSDIIKATIKDEMLHRDVNHKFANEQ